MQKEKLKRTERTRPEHGLVGNNNARKSDEKFFMPYTWATCAKPAAESKEDLKELRVQHRKLQWCSEVLTSHGK